jgi:hypothetical protein
MNEKEIQEGNKLIVEFLGGKQVDSIRIGGVDYEMFDLPADFPIKLSEPDIFGMKRMGYLGFHLQWDWLIPAWSRFLRVITKDRMAVHPHKHVHDDMFRVIDLNFQQAIFKDVPAEGQKVLSDAILWYNKNK